MKALSIKQPWAWLICAGYKDIENRNWHLHMPPLLNSPAYAKNVPMRIYVHAGKTFDKEGYEGLFDVRTRVYPGIIRTLEDHIVMDGTLDGTGCIIGEVDITGCVTQSTSPWFVGKYGFTLANPKLCDKPIPYRGQLGFFDIPSELRPQR